MVYIHGGPNENFKVYYLYNVSNDDGRCGLTPYTYPNEGVLYITKTVTLHMAAICRQYDAPQCTLYNSPERVYGNYCKDLRAYEYYGCTYEEYITDISDIMITDDNPENDNFWVTQYVNMNHLQTIPGHDEGISLGNIPRSTDCDMDTLSRSDK